MLFKHWMFCLSNHDMNRAKPRKVRETPRIKESAGEEINAPITEGAEKKTHRRRRYRSKAKGDSGQKAPPKAE